MTDRPVDPYARHRFDVDIGDDRPPLGFAEVSGLSVQVEARPPTEDESEDERPISPTWLDWGTHLGRTVGWVPPSPRRRTTSPTLTLRRGVTEDRRLWDWLQRWVAGRVDPRDVCVFLLDSDGDRARGWRCLRATPVRWEGPDLVADPPGVATETLELAHEGVEAIADDG